MTSEQNEELLNVFGGCGGEVHWQAGSFTVSQKSKILKDFKEKTF